MVTYSFCCALLWSDALVICRCWSFLALLLLSIGHVSYTETGFDISVVQQSLNPFDNPAYAPYTFSGGWNHVDFLAVEHKYLLISYYSFTKGRVITTDNNVPVTNANVHSLQQQQQMPDYYQPTYSRLLASYIVVSGRSHVPCVYWHQRVRCHIVASMYKTRIYPKVAILRR